MPHKQRQKWNREPLSLFWHLLDSTHFVLNSSHLHHGEKWAETLKTPSLGGPFFPSRYTMSSPLFLSDWCPSDLPQPFSSNNTARRSSFSVIMWLTRTITYLFFLCPYPFTRVRKGTHPIHFIHSIYSSSLFSVLFCGKPRRLLYDLRVVWWRKSQFFSFHQLVHFECICVHTPELWTGVLTIETV